MAVVYDSCFSRFTVYIQSVSIWLCTFYFVCFLFSDFPKSKYSRSCLYVFLSVSVSLSFSVFLFLCVYLCVHLSKTITANTFMCANFCFFFPKRIQTSLQKIHCQMKWEVNNCISTHEFFKISIFGTSNLLAYLSHSQHSVIIIFVSAVLVISHQTNGGEILNSLTSIIIIQCVFFRRECCLRLCLVTFHKNCSEYIIKCRDVRKFSVLQQFQNGCVNVYVLQMNVCIFFIMEIKL